MNSLLFFAVGLITAVAAGRRMWSIAQLRKKGLHAMAVVERIGTDHEGRFCILRYGTQEESYTRRYVLPSKGKTYDIGQRVELYYDAKDTGRTYIVGDAAERRSILLYVAMTVVLFALGVALWLQGGM